MAQSFTGNVYGQTGVFVPAGFCGPKSSMRSSYAFPAGSEIYAYRSTVRSSASSMVPILAFSSIMALVTAASSALKYD